MSTLAGEVAHPRKTFPRALFIGVGLVVFMYLGPLLVGLGVTTDADNWELGYFTEVAKLVGSFLSSLAISLDVMRVSDTCGAADSELLADVAEALRQVGGAWLGWWMVSAAAVSQIGQFEVLHNLAAVADAEIDLISNPNMANSSGA